MRESPAPGPGGRRPGDAPGPGRSPWAVTSLVLLGPAAFALTYRAGSRGLWPLDQCIAFDAAWRILRGQVPFRDFLLPCGPVAFWLQAAFFAVLGVSWRTFLLGAALPNVAAAYLGYGVLRHLNPRRPVLVHAGAWLTAIWFYPPFGTPYYDQVAFFFALASLYLVLRVRVPEGSTRRSAATCLAGAGALAALSVLSKQNVGVFLLPVLLLLTLVGGPPGRAGSRRDPLPFLGGLLGAGLAFTFWLVLASEPAAFHRFALVIPGGRGLRRLFGERHLLQGLLALLRSKAVFLSLAVLAVTVPLLGVYLRNRRELAPAWRRPFLAAAAVSGLVAAQHVYLETTSNQRYNGLPFLGICLATTLGLALRWVEQGRLTLRLDGEPMRLLRRSNLERLVRVGGAVLLSGLALLGIHASQTRHVQDIYRGAVFDRPLRTPGLEALRWGSPMRIRRTDLRAEDLERLVEALRARGSNFFVFPDFTLLYGVLGVPSPQPLVWFDRGLTHPRDYDEELDRWILRDLERHRVRTIVLEEEAAVSLERRLAPFPLLRSYILERFREEERISIFRIFHRREGPAAPSAPGEPPT